MFLIPNDLYSVGEDLLFMFLILNDFYSVGEDLLLFLILSDFYSVVIYVFDPNDLVG